MPVPLTFTEIKALTQVGDSPTNADRADVWDSIAYYIQQAEDKAQQAIDDVAAEFLTRPDFFPVRAWVKFATAGTLANGTVFAISSQSNVASAEMNAGSGLLRINFTAALADTNYKIEAYQKLAGVVTQLINLTLYAQTTGYAQFNPPSVGLNRDYFFIIRQEW